jgi:light-independent protochlorophyllide reductase subunit B
MQLTLWTYEGPPHVGAMRIATAMQDVHYVLHAPQGDTYADLLFTMIERREAPAGDLHHLPGTRSGRRHRRAVQDRRARGVRALQTQAMMVGASCTAELIQDDPGGLAAR